MSERIGFEERKTAVHLLRSGLTVAEVVEQLQVSESWVYKWHSRYKQGGWGGLKDRSRAPKHRSTAIADEVKRTILQVRSELEAKAASKQPGDLSYIGAGAIRARMKQAHGEVRLCSISSIERILKAAGVTHPQKVVGPPPTYPELRPSEPQQLIQVDIVPHFLPGGDNISCFNAIDVVSRYPIGEQHPTKSSTIAAGFLVEVWKRLGIPKYTQMDNEACFSGGFSHPGVLGKVLRLCLYVGTELVFSPFYHPQSNGSVERFHQDYNKNTWQKFVFQQGISEVRSVSRAFFTSYPQSGHSSVLNGRTPNEVHFERPFLKLAESFSIPKSLPLTVGLVHFMRLVSKKQQIAILNQHWAVLTAQPDQGVWATLKFTQQGAALRVYDAAPDAAKRTCLAVHDFPLAEQVLPLAEQFQRPVPVAEESLFSLAANLFRYALKKSVGEWFSTML